MKTTEFSEEEWRRIAKAMHITSLKYDHFIRVGSSYYKPRKEGARKRRRSATRTLRYAMATSMVGTGRLSGDEASTAPVPTMEQDAIAATAAAAVARMRASGMPGAFS